MAWTIGWNEGQALNLWKNRVSADAGGKLRQVLRPGQCEVMVPRDKKEIAKLDRRGSTDGAQYWLFVKGA